MFRHKATVALVVLAVIGSVAVATAVEPKPTTPKQITNSIGMKLTLIPAGEFLMGNEESIDAMKKLYQDIVPRDSFMDAYPQHRVRITKSFYLGTYHVTRGQFRQFINDINYQTDVEKGGSPGTSGPDRATKHLYSYSKHYCWRDPGFDQTDKHPAVNISWNDAVAFCKWLSGKEGKSYRLPTEAEWEYACRAGTTTRYYNGNDLEAVTKVGNVADATFTAAFATEGKYASKANDGFLFTAPVGSFSPNAFGLHDMHGNAYEWCSDWYDGDHAYYRQSPTDDPTGPKSGEVRVLRGGSWLSWPVGCRSAARDHDVPNRVYMGYAGFRVVRNL